MKGLLEVEFAFRAFLAETPGAFTVNMTNKKQQLEFSQTKATARQSHNAICCLFPQRFANKQHFARIGGGHVSAGGVSSARDLPT